MSDSMALLRKAVEDRGQAATARSIGYSASAVNQALKGKYAGSLSNLLDRVAEVYGSDTVHCPVMGEVPLRRCAEERRKPFAPTSPQRALLYRTCRGCTVHRNE